MVLGGGAVGSRVAQQLTDEGAEVVLIEHDVDRARENLKGLYPAVDAGQIDADFDRLLAELLERQIVSETSAPG